ncbi:MAG: PEP-CTERM sorting domain-containing protein [Fimbriimonadaceae bacterium]|jgi:hypothetical protein|nr:PEP-CTERM sorting domain-containing protein [Fimbriimonadaceae bacterium]
MSVSRITLITGLFALATSTFATPFFAATDLMSYDMTMSRYATLADAQSGTNVVSNHVLADAATNNRRDLGTYFVDGVPTYGSNFAAFLTAWYYTTEDNTNSLPKDDPAGNRYYSGWGNPNNTNTGFIQMYDDGATTISSMSGVWSTLAPGVANGSTFSLVATGENAGPGFANQSARLWHGGVGGAGSLTSGTFINYSISFTASGLTANWDPTHNLFVSTNHPVTITGGFKGIFENSGSDSSLHGFYVYSGSFNNTSWAFNQGDAALNGDFLESQFGAVPEPMTLSILALGALAAKRRRKAQKA